MNEKLSTEKISQETIIKEATAIFHWLVERIKIRRTQTSFSFSNVDNIKQRNRCNSTASQLSDRLGFSKRSFDHKKRHYKEKNKYRYSYDYKKRSPSRNSFGKVFSPKYDKRFSKRNWQQYPNPRTLYVSSNDILKADSHNENLQIWIASCNRERPAKSQIGNHTKRVWDFQSRKSFVAKTSPIESKEPPSLKEIFAEMTTLPCLPLQPISLLPEDVRNGNDSWNTCAKRKIQINKERSKELVKHARLSQDGRWRQKKMTNLKKKLVKIERALKKWKVKKVKLQGRLQSL